METLLTFVLAAAVTFLFVRGYLKKLTATKHAPPRPAGAAAPGAVKTIACPRCSREIVKGSAFCAHCGAALAMWSVHRAAVQVPSPGASASGKLQPVINASLCVGCGTCVHECPETGTLEMVGGKAILAHPERCVSHGKCAEVCPTQALTLAADGTLQTIKVPLVKENFETNVPGVFIVGELGGLGLIKTAINEGRLVIDHVRRDLPASGGNGDVYDVLIVGAGPAGLSASLTAHQHNLRYLTIEQGEIASTIRQYPRQKFLMAEPLEIPLYGSLYVADGTKEALLAVWETIISNTGVRIQTNERLDRVQRNGGYFHVETSRRRYAARNVVLAIGRRGTPRKLGVAGEELSKVAYRLIEAGDYEKKRVVVVGGGDSAIEAALALSRSGTNQVTLCHRGEDFRRARERNREHLESARAKGALQVLLNSTVAEIRPESVVVDQAGTLQEIPNDYVFVLAGGESPEEFLRKLGIEIVEKVLTA